MNAKSLLFIVCCIFLWKASFAQNLTDGRKTELFNFGWKFCIGDVPEASKPTFDDKLWRTLDLPHDWSIEGPFSEKWASCTAYLPGGIGWYRKTFKVEKALQGHTLLISFGGVYNNSEVWINGHYLGKRPNGYISFQYDLTPYLNWGEENVIAVRADHSKYGDSRWYTGSGIYRDVKLIITSPIRLKTWGTFITTPEISAEKAKVNIDLSLINEGEPATIELDAAIVFGKDSLAGFHKLFYMNRHDTVLHAQLEVENPHLWSTSDPYLYKLTTIVKKEGRITDNETVRFGIRSIRFDANKGFFLNGVNMKLKGICMHHDAGCLGAAVPRKVIARRLDILKEMGCNAIRTTHNEYSEDFLELCDEKGFLVKDEVFDEWELPKRKWLQGWNNGKPGHDGYSEYFREWHQRDLTDQIQRDRNHPSVIIWSIGNEVDYPTDPYTHPILDSEANPQTWAKHDPRLPDGNRMGVIAKELVSIVKQNDTTRPVGSGLASVLMSNETGYADALDVVGYNYQEFRYPQDHKKYPQRIIFGSENGMALDAWKAVSDNDYVLGQFLWTGIEYLGEAGKFPNRSNTAGVIDLAGNKKTEFYFRQSLWSDTPMVYIGTSDAAQKEGPGGLWSHKKAEPVWNWKEGQMVRIQAFSNCEEVELTLNNKSLGIKKMVDFPERIIGWEVPFQPGILKAIARNHGQEVASFVLQTTGNPTRLIAKPDTRILKADRQDVAHIEVNISDEAGNPVYLKEGEITCNISGNAKLLGLEDANPDNIEDYKDNHQMSYHGKVLVYIQSSDKPGKVNVTFTSPGLKPATVELEIQ